MPRRRTANQLDLLIGFIGLFFQRGKAAVISAVLVAGLTVLTFGWYLFQPAERKQEIGRLVGNYSASHKRIKVTEVLWDIWTLYFHRPFVPARLPAGQDGPVLLGEPERAAFPHPLRTLYNTAYTVGYCDALGDPAWVAYRAIDVAGTAQGHRRPPGFVTDTRTAARVETGDFIGSGYDRGHMAPNHVIDRCFGRAAQEETFLLSNVCPQRHRLNAGLWEELEARIADNYPGRYGEVWVIDGPVFGPEDRLQRLRGKVSVPVAFYMIILQRHEGGVRAEAFILGQDAPGRGTLDGYLVTVAEIEQKTGLSFFPKLDRKARAALEGQETAAVW